ncbi:hypothetical protein MUK42_17750 [Musa troglodytarum]|uniref:Uncharacterized protein n=1 Tax=Musa troglodytarum TaxID=320322 RepID=A0A9E7HRS8_9LILI|nr:hypothetical protein MUK42_17750 [Musa troglodytarum]
MTWLLPAFVRSMHCGLSAVDQRATDSRRGTSKTVIDANHVFLLKLSKRRGDDEGAEAEHNSSADKSAVTSVPMQSLEADMAYCDNLNLRVQRATPTSTRLRRKCLRCNPELLPVAIHRSWIRGVRSMSEQLLGQTWVQVMLLVVHLDQIVPQRCLLDQISDTRATPCGKSNSNARAAPLIPILSWAPEKDEVRDDKQEAKKEPNNKDLYDDRHLARSTALPDPPPKTRVAEEFLRSASVQSVPEFTNSSTTQSMLEFTSSGTNPVCARVHQLRHQSNLCPIHSMPEFTSSGITRAPVQFVPEFTSSGTSLFVPEFTGSGTNPIN